IIVKPEPPRGTGPHLFGFYWGTQLEETPVAVQETIKREAAGSEIADIDKEHRDGRVVYEVEFKQRGKNSEIHIAEDGTILRDSRKDTALGAPGKSESGTENNSKLGVKTLSIKDVPEAVQKQIEANSDGSKIKGITIHK